MIGGHARVVQDVPPYLMIDGISGCIVGLNLVGLRRNGFVAEEIAELKAAYRLIYRSGLKWSEIVQQLEPIIRRGPASEFQASSRKAPADSSRNAGCRRPPPSNFALPTTKSSAADDQKRAAG